VLDQVAAGKGSTHVVLDLRDLRTLEGIGLEGVTNLQRLDVRQELFLELVVHLFVNKDSGTGTACLAVVEEDTCGRYAV
jgi:hypothetical protein